MRISRPADDKRARAVYRHGVLAWARRLRPDPQKLDYAVAAVLTVVLQLELWLTANQPHHRIYTALVGSLLTGAVAIRRRYPTTVGAGAGIAGVVTATLAPSNLATFGIAWICDMYALAAWSRGRRFVIGLLVYVVPAVVTTLITGSASGVSKGMQFIVISTIVILLVHRVLGDKERRARLAERERDVAAREAVADERARIARELHDAIAHNVSMMVVQAGAERRVLDDGRGTTREVLETIEHIGRGALTEMRRLVGMLRSDGGEPLAPQPGLDDLPTLVTQVREAGLPVELQVEGERRELPVGIELSAYRIVQEALTNALKHAGEAKAVVRVHYGPESLELEIVDDGPGGSAAELGGGHGLVGMRERVALYGGRLDAGRRPSGGFAVRVLLPTR
jgi:signal transduction histidine kinase